MKYKMFSPNRLIFGKQLDTPEGSPKDLSDFQFSTSKNISDSLMGESFDGAALETKKAPTMEKLAADLYETLSSSQNIVFRAIDEGRYAIISGRDGATIGEANVVIQNGTPVIEATQFIPIYTPDLQSYTYEEKTAYYKTAVDFQKDLSIFAEDLRTS